MAVTIDGSANTVTARATESLVRATSIASTSGTVIEFTNIPSWVKRITVMLQGVSTSGSSPLQAQIGLTTYVTTGYASGMGIYNSNTINAATFTTGIPIDIANAGLSAALVRNGCVTINNLSGNIYVATSVFGHSAGSLFGSTGGSSVTSNGVIDRIRITAVNGTDTFDAGSVNIMYE